MTKEQKQLNNRDKEEKFPQMRKLNCLSQEQSSTIDVEKVHWRIRPRKNCLSLPAAIRARLEFIRAHLRLTDINCLTYLALLAGALLFIQRPPTYWLRYFLLHIFLCGAILALIYFSESNSSLKILVGARVFYPVAVLLLTWNEMNELLHLIFSHFWATELVVKLDYFLFGVHPTIWMQKFYHPALDELMCFLYTCYYLFLPIVTLILFLKKKRDETFAVFSVVTLAYFSNFIVFYFFPTLGPHMAKSLQSLSTTNYTGYLFAWINRTIQANAGVVGGAFPSSHISGATALTIIVWRYYRPLGYWLAPLVIAIAFSTVYLGYHHAVDPLIGFLWGGIFYVLGLKILKRRGEDPLS